MKKRLVALLLAFLTAACLISAPPAAADDGIIGGGVEVACDISTPVVGAILDKVSGGDLCDEIGDEAEKQVKEAWKAVWDSVLGDVLKSAIDGVKWLLQKVLTVALLGPSLDLEATGLFTGDATLAGMLVWLGWVIAAFGLMWQLGRMALSGQMKYAGQALVGWVQNALLTSVGLTIVAMLLQLGDVLTTGLVDATFEDDGKAYERIVAVLMPAAISNPIIVLGVVAVLLLVGFLQMIMVFLRQSAIPIQCLLLPIAGAGRVGGDSTRQWAPRLITSILVVIAYKPILAIIICTGFAEFGHSQTLAEWLRGVATLVLGVLAPGPLTKLFAPIGAEVGAGMSVGGAVGAAASIGSYIGGRKGGSSGEEGDAPTDAVKQAQYLEQSMGSQRQAQGQGQDADSGGGDAVAHANRNQGGAKVPAQAGAGGAAEAGGLAAGAAGSGVGAGAGAGAAGGAVGGAAASGAAAAGPAGAAAGLSIQVIDGVNNAVQSGANEIGDGGKL